MSEKFHIRIALPDGSFTKAGTVTGDQTQIIKLIHECGAGVSEMAEGNTEDMIRIKTC